jgi:CP family cyanate transporter-like MFS transporter
MDAWASDPGTPLDDADRPRPALAPWLVITGIVLVASNLRPSVTAVGPLVSVIRHDTGISAGAAGLLTALPLLCFGLLSPAVPTLARRLGPERLVGAGLLVLMVGILLRGTPGTLGLFAGTVLLGFGIVAGNVLLPAIVKRTLPARAGPMTAIFSVSMSGSAALASGISVPLAEGAGIGWRAALAVWAAPAVAALLVWLPWMRGPAPLRASRQERGAERPPGLWRSALAWQVTAFFGLQSLIFYMAVTWMPSILSSQGMSAAEGGWLVSISQAIGLVPSLAVPIVAARLRSQRALAVAAGVMVATSALALLAGGVAGAVLGVFLIFVGTNSGFALALTLLVLRARDAGSAARLSGMAQSAGYLLAASGPVVFGVVHDHTGGWTAPLLLVCGLSAAMLVAGVGAGRRAYVG